MKLMFGWKRKSKKAEFYTTALKKGREIRPLESTGIGSRGTNSTCAVGAIALGLGFSDYGFWGTSDVSHFMIKHHSDFPIEQVIHISDHAPYGEKDTEVIAYLNTVYGD